MIPFSDRVYFSVSRGGDIIQRSEGAIAVDPKFRIRVFCIVQDLILKTFSRSGCFRLLLRHKILDAAVRPLGKPEIHRQFETSVFVYGHDVSTKGGFAPARSLDNQHTVPDLPSPGRQRVDIRPAPSIQGFSVKQELPPFFALFCRERIWTVFYNRGRPA